MDSSPPKKPQPLQPELHSGPLQKHPEQPQLQSGPQPQPAMYLQGESSSQFFSDNSYGKEIHNMLPANTVFHTKNGVWQWNTNFYDDTPVLFCHEYGGLPVGGGQTATSNIVTSLGPQEREVIFQYRPPRKLGVDKRSSKPKVMVNFMTKHELLTFVSGFVHSGCQLMYITTALREPLTIYINNIITAKTKFDVKKIITGVWFNLNNDKMLHISFEKIGYTIIKVPGMALFSVTTNCEY